MAISSGALTAISLGAKVISVVGSVVQGVQQSRAAEQQARVQEQQAQQERLIAAQEAKQYQRRQSRLQAASRAARGASGVQRAGSVLLVDDDQAREIALGAATIRAGGEVSATRLEQQAYFTRQRGQTSLVGGFFNAGSTLLGAAELFDTGDEPAQPPAGGTR